MIVFVFFFRFMVFGLQSVFDFDFVFHVGIHIFFSCTDVFFNVFSVSFSFFVFVFVSVLQGSTRG